MSAEEDIILITISMGALRIKTSILLLLTIYGMNEGMISKTFI